jgi:hypothetical protein
MFINRKYIQVPLTFVERILKSGFKWLGITKTQLTDYIYYGGLCHY